MRTSITRRKNSYEGCVNNNGKRIRRSFQTKDKAEDWITEVKASLETNPNQPMSNFSVSHMKVWSDMEDAFVVARENHWRGNKDEQKTCALAQQAVEYFGENIPLKALSKSDIDGYISYLKNELENSDSTINRKLSALSVMLKEALEYGWINSIPKITRRKVEAKRLSYFTDSERDSIRTCIVTSNIQGSIVIALLFDFLCDTGLRINEALKLSYKDIKVVDGVDVVHVAEGKKNESLPRFVPLTNRAKEVIKQTKLHRPLSFGIGPFSSISYADCRRAWDRVREKLNRKEKDFVWHTCRHTFCSRLVQKGTPLPVVAQLAGHKNIATTMRYVHLDTKSSLTAIEKLDD